MIGLDVPPTQMSLRIRTLFASAWIRNWHASASHLLFTVLETNRLTVHSAINASWVVQVDWTGDSIIITEASGNEPHYRFKGMKAAFVFLDALLMSHVSRLVEPEQAISRHAQNDDHAASI